MKDKNKARDEIFAAVAEYAEKFHQPKIYKQGDKMPYAARFYDKEELINLVDSALEFWLTSGKWTARFEKELAAFIGVKYCSFVNSGSSANLLAFMALTSPLLGEKRILRGDEVITVAAGFPTTVSPIIQYGAVPVFVDVTIPQYNIDVTMLDEALSPKTKAVMLAHTLGNPFDIAAVKQFCDKNNLWLIEDNCDALGSEYNGQQTGTFGHIGTSSFYPPHHITTGEGGAVYTSERLLAKIVRSMRDWGRDCECPSGVDNLCGHRFDKQYGELPVGYDHKYVYSHLGYNLKATDMQASVGVAQLKKLPGFIERRRHNFDLLKSSLGGLGDKIILPETCPDSKPNWFGFLITCRKGVNRADIVAHLEANGIQTRMLFAGNLKKHPCCIGENFKITGSLENTDIIMNDTFWVGVYPGLNDENLLYMAEMIKSGCDI